MARRFNKESYITDASYVIHISELSTITKRSLAELSELLGIVWDEDVIAIPVFGDELASDDYSPPETYIGYDNIEYYNREGFFGTDRRTLMVEGTSSNGSEVIFLRRETTNSAAGQTSVWINGIKYNKTQLVKAARRPGMIDRKIKEGLETEEDLYSDEKSEQRVRDIHKAYYKDIAEYSGEIGPAFKTTYSGYVFRDPIKPQRLSARLRQHERDRTAGLKEMRAHLRQLALLKDAVDSHGSKADQPWETYVEDWEKSATDESKARKEARKKRGIANRNLTHGRDVPVDPKNIKNPDLDWS